MKEQIPFPEKLVDYYDIAKAVGGIVVDRAVGIVKFVGERISGQNPYPLDTPAPLDETLEIDE